MSVYLVVQGKLKAGAEKIYENYLRGVAPLMAEYAVEIVAVGAGLNNEFTTEAFPINAVMKLADEESLEKFLGDERYLKIKSEFRDAAYEDLHLSVFRGREPRKID